MPTSKYHPYKGKGGHAARCALCVKTTPAGLAGWVEIHVEGEAASYRSGHSVRAIGQVTTQMAEIIKACDNLVPVLIPLAHRTCAESAAATLAVGKRLQGHTTVEQDEQTMPPSMPKQQQDWATTRAIAAEVLQQIQQVPALLRLLRLQLDSKVTLQLSTLQDAEAQLGRLEFACVCVCDVFWRDRAYLAQALVLRHLGFGLFGLIRALALLVDGTSSTRHF
ncbi:hypothetical protein QJQ45_012667 [Haematococcus lacustris]|nr:hypothetical protein QJQ45_012667 [Haematococcus lacustris]